MKRSLVLFPLIATLTACGGSDGDASTPQPTQLASVISGELQGVDGTNITINNKNIDASNAVVSIGNGKSRLATAEELKQLAKGMMLTVDTQNNQATSIKFDELLEAPVTLNDGKSLEVAGFTLILPTGTNISKYPVKAMVEVSGFALDNNRIQVTYIQLEDDQSDSEIKGTITGLDEASKSFYLGSIHITNYQTIENLKNGNWVEAKGELKYTETTTGSPVHLTELNINNAEIKIDTPDYADTNGEIELEGRINWVAPNQSHLVINQNQSVTITNSTRFEDGKKANLQVGKLIEVEGKLNLDSMSLVASEVEFDDGDKIEVNLPEFEVTGYAAYNSTKATITLNSINFEIAPFTQFERDDRDIPRNEINDFSREWVEISGYELGDTFITTEVEIESRPGNTNKIELEGKLLAFDETPKVTYKLMGYTFADTVANNLLKDLATKRVEAECTLNADGQLGSCSELNEDIKD